MPRSDFPNRILVETDDVIAWNKPAGLATTGRDLDDRECAQFLAMQYADDMIWALHQLDRDTSGVVLFAKRKSLVAAWQKRWHSPAVQKYYVALVHSRLPQSPMTIDAPLLRLERTGYTRVTVDDAGKEATTICWELSASTNYSLVLAKLVTGRTHQVRAHLQYVGCPLIGEQRYNAIPCGHHDRQALHALAIVTDQGPPLDRIEAPLAEDLQETGDKLGIDLTPLTNWFSRTQAPQ